MDLPLQDPQAASRISQCVGRHARTVVTDLDLDPGKVTVRDRGHEHFDLLRTGFEGVGHQIGDDPAGQLVVGSGQHQVSAAVGKPATSPHAVRQNAHQGVPQRGEQAWVWSLWPPEQFQACLLDHHQQVPDERADLGMVRRWRLDGVGDDPDGVLDEAVQVLRDAFADRILRIVDSLRGGGEYLVETHPDDLQEQRAQPERPAQHDRDRGQLRRPRHGDDQKKDTADADRYQVPEHHEERLWRARAAVRADDHRDGRCVPARVQHNVEEHHPGAADAGEQSH